ncbi:MAG: hypothetical protein HC876_05440 [Chloroflexaceae bacterium]|nr:hypothetical protein [Chloroflexaceae bacterium]
MSAADTRAWLGRVLLSVLLALTIGVLAYLLARAITTGYVLYQQQQLFQELGGVLQGGDIEALASSNLRTLRQRIEALNAYYAWFSVQIGFGAAALGAVGSYLWLEREAARAGE